MVIMMLYDDCLDLIGNTPLVQLNRLKNLYNLEANIYAKCESNNLTGSVKDRVALNMILNAEKKGELQSGSIIIEPTSGNTGIGLAVVGKLKDYKVILTMPESMSEERKKLLRIYGAELVLTPANEGMEGAIKKAYELKEKYHNSIILNQFSNLDNLNAHYLFTGPEIYNDLKNVDVLVAGIGTGGTISGVGQFLKEKNSKIKIIGVEPELSSVLSNQKKGKHGIQGIGAGFIPDILNKDILDEMISVSDENAYKMTKIIVEVEGLLVGVSSGAAMYATIKIAQKYPNKNIVVIFPDTGLRYLSTNIFNAYENK